MRALVEYAYMTEDPKDSPVEEFLWVEVEDGQLTKELVEKIINHAHEKVSVPLPYLDFNEGYENGEMDKDGYMGENDDVMVAIMCIEDNIGSVAQTVEHEGEILGVDDSKSPRSTNSQEEYLKSIIGKQQEEITFLRSVLREMDTAVAVHAQKVRVWDREREKQKDSSDGETDRVREDTNS